MNIKKPDVLHYPTPCFPSIPPPTFSRQQHEPPVRDHRILRQQLRGRGPRPPRGRDDVLEAGGLPDRAARGRRSVSSGEWGGGARSRATFWRLLVNIWRFFCDFLAIFFLGTSSYVGGVAIVCGGMTADLEPTDRCYLWEEDDEDGTGGDDDEGVGEWKEQGSAVRSVLVGHGVGRASTLLLVTLETTLDVMTTTSLSLSTSRQARRQAG